MSLKVIVFDFDGVLVDSNHIKRNAYYQMFNSFENGKKIVENVLSKYEPNTRNFIIGKIVEQFVKRRLINSKDITKHGDKFVKQYGDICENEVSRCNEIRGALDNIKKLSPKYSLYINSLTPVEPLTRIIRKRMLVEFFKGIFGGEKSKTENLKTIISIEKISPTELLIIGDSISDFKVAYNSGTKFIGIDGGDEKLRNKKLKYLLKDCSHLYEVVERMRRET